MAGTQHIAVVGPASADEQEVGDGEEVGRRLAQRGVVVVCGGLGGVMTAAAKGAAQEGGTVIGLLPGLDRSAANPWVTHAIPTGLGEMRNALIIRAADAVIAVGGAYGTLSEIALALKSGLPVVGLRTWVLPDVEAVESAQAAVERALERAASGERRR